MIWIGILIGLVLGANASLFLYAIILVGKRSEGNYEQEVRNYERRE